MAEAGLADAETEDTPVTTCLNLAEITDSIFENGSFFRQNENAGFRVETKF